MLQCRSGKCTGIGAVKIVVDMVKEGLIDTRSAIKMVEPRHLDQLLHPQVGDLKIIFYIPSIVVAMLMTICWYYLLLRFCVSDCLKHCLPPFGLNETNSVCLILNLYEILEPHVFGCYLSYQFKDPTRYKDSVIATGLPASPGAAIGQIVFNAEDAEAWHAQEKAVILICLIDRHVFPLNLRGLKTYYSF